MTEMPTVVFEGDENLILRGVKWTATGTSDPEETKDRWTDIEIHALTSDSYVVFGAGRSTVEGETDRHWMHYCEDAEALIKALLRPQRGGGRHMPAYADAALKFAAEKDPLVRQAVAAWESAARWAR